MASLCSKPSFSLRHSVARPAPRRAALLRVRAEKQTEQKPSVPPTPPSGDRTRLDQVLEVGFVWGGGTGVGRPSAMRGARAPLVHAEVDVITILLFQMP